MTTATWSGPLPPPSVLEQFNDIVPNCAERIVANWEAESTHRRSLERRELTILGWSELAGKVFALLFVLGALALAGYAVANGQPWVAALFGGGTIAAVVWAFIRTNKRT